MSLGRSVLLFIFYLEFCRRGRGGSQRNIAFLLVCDKIESFYSFVKHNLIAFLSRWIYIIFCICKITFSNVCPLLFFSCRLRKNWVCSSRWSSVILLFHYLWQKPILAIYKATPSYLLWASQKKQWCENLCDSIYTVAREAHTVQFYDQVNMLLKALKLSFKALFGVQTWFQNSLKIKKKYGEQL